ncbi:uncharacterized protein TNCV_1668421 [Trichonephila clavipes]|nr:uncharacterized protein TNCV_1668421 [Trichonephila clavipes]
MRLSLLLILNLNSSLKTTWFHFAAVQFPHAQHHSKRKRRLVGVKGRTRNGCRDSKCPSARPLRMVREDTGGPDEDATFVFITADEAVGRVHSLRCDGLLHDWFAEVLCLFFV